MKGREERKNRFIVGSYEFFFFGEGGGGVAVMVMVSGKRKRKHSAFLKMKFVL